MLVLNEFAWELCDPCLRTDMAERYRIDLHRTDSGVTLFDFGLKAKGGLEAGLLLARICLSGLADVQLEFPRVFDGATTAGATTATRLPQVRGQIVVRTDHPILACLGSQYAGWQLQGEKFFGMGSGPMRALAQKESILRDLKLTESAPVAVGVIEAGQLPPDPVCLDIAEACRIPPKRLRLCVAPTASLAGTIQVVARSVETALHKLHSLEYDVSQVVSGWGIAPLPPIAADNMVAIGRTNDAILYGSTVTLWVRDTDENLQSIVDQIPSQASHDYGVPFLEIFRRYEGDFYRIDPHLFSPAVIQLNNLNTGRTFTAGSEREDLLQQSFAG